MKKVFIILLVLLLSACNNSTATKELENKVSELESQNSELTEELKNLTETSKQMYNKLDELGYIKVESNNQFLILDKPITVNANNDKTYGLNEYWEVPGMWKLKIDQVKLTKERNQFSDKKPKQVVIVTYTYENLGYTNDIQDLFMTPEQVIDEKKIVAETYPVTGGKTPKPTPVGAIMQNASDVFGLENESSNITITFEKYDSNHNKHKATFVVPVSK